MSHRLQDLKVYVINLDRRQDRWETVYRILKRAGFINIERVSAIDGKMIDSDQLKKIVHPSVYTSLGKVRKNHEDLGSVGAIGCYLSHYKVWKMIEVSNEPSIVVEDDLLCHPLLNEYKLSKDITPLTKYDFVLLGSFLREKHKLPQKAHSQTQGIYPYNGLFFGTHFYYLTPQGARYFSKDALPIEYQVDCYMAFKFSKDKSFRSAVHVPDMGSQFDLNMTTDIQTPRVTFASSILIKVQHEYNSLSTRKRTCVAGLILIFTVLLYILHVMLSYILKK